MIHSWGAGGGGAGAGGGKPLLYERVLYTPRASVVSRGGGAWWWVAL